MKRIIVLAFVLVFSTTWAFAADFVPTIMTLTAPSQIQYDFDGEDLSIPFTVTGTPASVWLVINTHGQAEDIVAVQNGFLGWHYVNKIDTTVYVSSRYQKDPGDATIIWDGTDQDGNAVGAGTYDYYLWAYDNQTPRYMACKFVKIAQNWDQCYVQILEVGEDGLPLAHPLLAGSKFFWETAGWDGDEDQWFDHGTHFKWALGGDPYDRSLMQTTVCGSPYIISKDYDEYMASGYTYGQPVFDPNDYGIFYHCSTNFESGVETLFKWTFVSNGEAIRDEDWGGWDNINFADNPMVTTIGEWGTKAACYTDRNYIYLPRGPGILTTDMEWNNLTCVDFDGEVVFDRNMAEWFMPDDPNPHSYINSGIRYIYSRTPNQWLLVSLVSCMHDMVDTSRIIADPDADPED